MINLQAIAHYILFVAAAVGLGLLLAHLLDPNQHSYEVPSMSVSEKLTVLQQSVNDVTALVKSQNQQLADQSKQVAELKDKLATSEADGATLQAQIDQLNSLLPGSAPAAQ